MTVVKMLASENLALCKRHSPFRALEKVVDADNPVRGPGLELNRTFGASPGQFHRQSFRVFVSSCEPVKNRLPDWSLG